MYDPDPFGPPPGHDPVPWRVGLAIFAVLFFGASYLSAKDILPIDPLVAILPSAFLAAIVGVIVKERRSGDDRSD